MTDQRCAHCGERTDKLFSHPEWSKRMGTVTDPPVCAECYATFDARIRAEEDPVNE